MSNNQEHCSHATGRMIQVQAAPAVHGEGQQDIPMAAHGLVNGDGGAIAGSTGVTVQPLKLNMSNPVTVVFIESSIAQNITQLDARPLGTANGPCTCKILIWGARGAGLVGGKGGRYNFQNATPTAAATLH